MLFIRSLGSGLHLRCLVFPSIVSGMPTRWGRLQARSSGAGASGNAGDGQGQSANPSASVNPSGVGAAGIANDGSGSANPLPFHCTQDTRDSLINYMESRHIGSRHITLNNTTSTRPKKKWRAYSSVCYEMQGTHAARPCQHFLGMRFGIA